MIINCYTIFDCKAAAYSNPWYQVNDDMAVRVIEEVLFDGTSTIARHPADHRVYRIGTFDTDTGILHCLNNPVFCFDVASLLPRPTANNPDNS